jgi:hypothetical protein
VAGLVCRVFLLPLWTVASELLPFGKLTECTCVWGGPAWKPNQSFSWCACVRAVPVVCRVLTDSLLALRIEEVGDPCVSGDIAARGSGFVIPDLVEWVFIRAEITYRRGALVCTPDDHRTKGGTP